MEIPRMHEYEQAVRDFAWQLPPTFNFGRDVVDWRAREADKEALVWRDQTGEVKRYRFSDISRESAQVAHLLARKGVRQGDRVLVLLPRIPEWQIAMVACLKIGAVPIPCIEMLTRKDVKFRIDHSGATAAITTSANTPKFADSEALVARICIGEPVDGWTDIRDSRAFEGDFPCADIALDAPAILYYTSGSSGLPKGVTHPSRSLFAWRVCAAYWHGLDHTDTMWCTADTGWSKAGTGILFGPWSRGASVFFYNGRFDAHERLRLIAEHDITVFCAAATEFRHLIQLPVQEFDLSRLRLTVSAGESVNPEVVKKWRELTGTQLLDGYGQTETLMTIHNYSCMPVKPGSMGRPLPGTVAEIVTEDGQIAPAGVTGQLAIKLPHPTFMLGYWNDAQRTKASMIRVGEDDYWATGDLCYRDADGYFFYAGRNDDIISSAGYRIGPTEVENALIEHPAVSESAVVASPDKERGEVVKAFVVLREGHRPSPELVKALQAHVQVTTAPYKYPRKIEFVDELPKGPTGKLLRRVLREREFSFATKTEAPDKPGSDAHGAHAAP